MSNTTLRVFCNRVAQGASASLHSLSLAASQTGLARRWSTVAITAASVSSTMAAVAHARHWHANALAQRSLHV